MLRNAKGGGRISEQQYMEYLINTYQNLILSICYKMTQNYFDAEDLTQETFLSAYRNLDSFDRRYEKAWLARIAVNKCTDYKRSAKNRAEPAGEDTFLTITDPASSVERRILEKEIQLHLKTCCEQLKSPYREVALAHFYEEKNVEEIAAETGKKRKTIQTQLYRAKEQLRKLYGKEELYGNSK